MDSFVLSQPEDVRNYYDANLGSNIFLSCPKCRWLAPWGTQRSNLPHTYKKLCGCGERNTSVEINTPIYVRREAMTMYDPIATCDIIREDTEAYRYVYDQVYSSSNDIEWWLSCSRSEIRL